MEKALKTDQEAIRKDMEKEKAYAKHFQPFMDEFLCNEYQFEKPENKWKEIRDMIYSGTLERFMKEKALFVSPYFDTMPVSKEKKLELVDVDMVFPNYYELKLLFSSIQVLPIGIRSRINNFFLNKQNELTLTDNVINSIKDRHTLYGSMEQYEVFESLTLLLNTAKQLQQKTGISIFSNGVVINASFGNLTDAEINANRILHRN